MSPDRHRGRSPCPSQRSGGCSTINEETEASWSRQQPRGTCPSRWTGRNQRSHDNLRHNVADRKMANPVDPVRSHNTSQKGNLRQCQNYRTISLISHPSKVTLMIILNRLKPQAETTAENRQASDQEGAPQNRSST